MRCARQGESSKAGRHDRFDSSQRIELGRQLTLLLSWSVYALRVVQRWSSAVFIVLEKGKLVFQTIHRKMLFSKRKGLHADYE